MNKELKEIGYESVKVHSRVYRVLGFQKKTINSGGKKRKVTDKNFIEIIELHPASRSIATTFPFNVPTIDKREPIVFDPLKKIEVQLDLPWEESMMDLIPNFDRKKDEWIMIIPSMLSKREVLNKRIVKDGKMKIKCHNKRVAKHWTDEDKNYQLVETLRDFLKIYNKSLGLHLHHYIKF